MRLSWVELSGLEPLTSCMPCPAIPSATVPGRPAPRTSGRMQCPAGSGTGRKGLDIRRCWVCCTRSAGLAEEVRPLTSGATVDNLHTRPHNGPVIATAAPGRVLRAFRPGQANRPPQGDHRMAAGRAVADRLIRITTALAVAAVATVAAVISYRHAYELVTTHSQTRLTPRLLPFTVDRLHPGGQHAHSRRQPPATSPYHRWRAGAWAPVSPPSSAPTWPMVSATDPSEHWSAPGPPWPWQAPSNSS